MKERPETEKLVETQGKKARKRKVLQTGRYGIGQAVFGGFLTISKLGLASLVKYVISAASIPFEVINLIAEVDHLIEKQSAPSKIAFVIILGVGSMVFLAMVDAVKWGGYQVGFLASVAAAGPFVFTTLLSIATVLSAAGFIKKALYLYRNPHERTPLKKLGLTHKAIKTVGFAVLTVCVALFAIAFVANPMGATIALSIIGATLVTMVALKIVKTIQENHTWKKTIEELKGANKNPCDVVDVDRLKFHHALQYDEEMKKKNFLIKFKNILLTNWRGRFGTVEQKIQIAADKEKTVSAVLKESYDIAMTKVKDNPEKILEIQKAYDLIRKPRGRLMFQEAVEKAQQEKPVHECFGGAAKSDAQILRETEAPELQEALHKERVEQAKREQQEKIDEALKVRVTPSTVNKEKDEVSDDTHIHPDEHHH